MFTLCPDERDLLHNGSKPLGNHIKICVWIDWGKCLWLGLTLESLSALSWPWHPGKLDYQLEQFLGFMVLDAVGTTSWVRTRVNRVPCNHDLDTEPNQIRLAMKDQIRIGSECIVCICQHQIVQVLFSYFDINKVPFPALWPCQWTL